MSTMIDHKNLQDIKIINRAKVLRMICEQPGLTRKMIALKTQLSNMSVANIIGEYMKRGLICESVSAPEGAVVNAGRPSHRIDVCADALYIIGIFVSEMEVTCSIINFKCQIVARNTIVPTTTESNDELIDTIDALLSKTLEAIPDVQEKLIGIGIASVGLIDYSGGRILRADNYPNIRNLPLVDYYKKRFCVPVIISNDMCASAIAEKYFGNSIGVSDFLFLGVYSSIGTGIYLDDHVYRGFYGLSGELGFTTVDYHDETDVKPRQLESYVRIDRYVAQANRDFANGVAGMPTFSKNHLITWMDIVNEAQKENPYCVDVITRIATYISLTIVNLINLFDPQMIVIGGQVAAAGELLLSLVNERIRGKSVKRFLADIDDAHRYRETRVLLSKFGDQSAVVGAGALLFNAIFEGSLSLL